jgi:hypothetical protein
MRIQPTTVREFLSIGVRARRRRPAGEGELAHQQKVLKPERLERSLGDPESPEPERPEAPE